MTLAKPMALDRPIHVADIGAAAIAEAPPYKPLLDLGLARLSAFDGDERQRQGLLDTYGPSTAIYTEIIADGNDHTLYLSRPEYGMSSILKPSKTHLEFFNGFAHFGEIIAEMDVKSRRLDEVEGLDSIDYLKMDTQGSELLILQNGENKLRLRRHTARNFIYNAL